MSKPINSFHIHLVSDSTGETITHLSRACLVQFDNCTACENVWPLVRTAGQLGKVLEAIEAHPGPVIFTMVDIKLRKILEDTCRDLQVPCVPVMDPVMNALRDYLNMEIHARPGRQHEMDAEYFARIDAMHFALAHDDGQMTHDLYDADVVVLGVSRTSKTPTCMYLANRGLKAANIPVVPGVPLPIDLTQFKKPLIVGLTKDPNRLIQIRRNRLNMLNESSDTDYVDPEIVAEEVKYARRICLKNSWPVIDVTRKSIEETATAIQQLINKKNLEKDTAKELRS